MNVDGTQVPSKPLQLCFNNELKLYIDTFHCLLSGTGIHFPNKGIGINRFNYAKKYFLTAFDLTPNLSAHCASHLNLVRSGSVRIEVGFDTALTATINCIVYVKFNNVLEIDATQQIVMDNSA